MTGVRLPEINVIVVSGRIVRDAEFAVTPSGIAKCTARIAVNRRVKDSKTGEWKDDAFFIDAIVWREQAERAKEKAKKGMAVVIEGRLSGREYEDKATGQKKSFFEIVANRIQFLAAADKSAAPESQAEPAGGAPAGSGDLEEVPF